MSFSLSGLASGLDTNTIISQLMQLERIPYQKLEQKQSTLSSKQSIFRSINTKLNTLRTAAEDLLLKSNFNLRSATVSDETVLRATVSENVLEGSYHIEVKQLATKHSVQTEQFTKEDLSKKLTELISDLDQSGGSFEFTISVGEESKPIKVEYDENTTLEEALNKLAQEINNSDLKVHASLITTNENSGAKRLVITSQEFGTANSLDFSGENSILKDLLGIKTDDGLNDAVKPQDASIVVNGVEIEASSNNLNDVIPGINLTLLKAGETATINVTKDLDKITEKVEAFVKAYNDVINTIRSNTAKDKALQGDSTLRSLESQLYGLFNSKVEVGQSDQFKYLFDIGLEIDKGITSASAMTGTINFDKEKFKAALAENPDEVYKLFAFDNRTAGNDSVEGVTNSNEEGPVGIARLFRNTLMDWTRSGTGILTSRIDGFDSEISFIKKQMDDMNIRLEMKEKQLRQQFTAMETALIQLQNQQAWMASQIASMGYYNY